MLRSLWRRMFRATPARHPEAMIFANGEHRDPEPDPGESNDTEFIEPDSDRNQAARAAALLLSDIDYQLNRLAQAPTGGDGGIRDEWSRIVREIDLKRDAARPWQHFWA